MNVIEWNVMQSIWRQSMHFWINHIEIKVNDKNYCLRKLYEFFIFIELILSSVSKFLRRRCRCHHHAHTVLPFAQHTFFAWFSLLLVPTIFRLNWIWFGRKKMSMLNAVLYLFLCFLSHSTTWLLLYFFCQASRPVNSYSTNLVESNLFDELTMDINGLNFGFMQMKWHWIFFYWRIKSTAQTYYSAREKKENIAHNSVECQNSMETAKIHFTFFICSVAASLFFDPLTYKYRVCTPYMYTIQFETCWHSM